MLEAWTDAMDLAEHATTAQNTALENQEKYEASFNGRLQQLTTKMNKFWIELLNSNIVDSFIDMLTKLVDSFNALSDAAGPGTAAVVGLITALMGVGRLKDIILFFTSAEKMKNAFGKVICPLWV